MTVTAASVLGPGTTISITAPSSINVPVDTNGWVLRVTTSGADTTCDISKFVLTVTDPGYDTTGASVTQTRTIYATGILRKPWNNETQNSTPAGTFDLTLSEHLYTGSIVTGVSFAAGFTTGSSAQTFTAGSVTRGDNLAYPKCKVRAATRPFVLITSANTAAIEVMGTHRAARNGGPFACVEAWYRQSTTDFAVGRSGTQVASVSTPKPSGGGSVSGTVAPVYRVPIEGSAATDGAGVVRYQVKPWIGDSASIWKSWVDGDAWPTLNAPAELPMVRDYAGKFQGAYAFVNQSATAGASPAVQTTLTDPGTAGSYATAATALAAIRAFNAARTGGLAHDDVSGGTIVFREIAGSTRGADANSYNLGGASLSSGATYPVNATGVPYEIRSLTGLVSDGVRMRGTKPDGSTLTSKSVGQRVVWRGITFDSEGQTVAANNSVVSGVSAGGQATSGVTFDNACAQFLVDCIVSETTAINPASSTALLGFGFRYDYRVAHYNARSGTGIGANASYITGLAVSMGSLYQCDTMANAPFAPTCFGGMRIVRNLIATQGAGVQPLIRAAVIAGLRIDTEGSSSSAIVLNASNVRDSLRTGIGCVNILVRCVGTTTATGFSFAADGNRTPTLDCDFHHIVSFGDGAVAGRANFGYQDSGYVRVPKEISMIGFVANSFNMKSDGFLGSSAENPSGTYGATGPMDTSVAWTWGSIVHDNNATLSARLVYQAIRDVPIGTAITDTSYWYPPGAVWSTQYGRQPLRTGNWTGRNGVDSRGCVWTTSADGGHNATSFGPDNLPIDTIFGTGTSADYYRNPAIGTTATATDATDFTPKILAIEGIDSPLLNRIRAGMQPVSIDIFGNARDNTGAGAAGPVERASVANAPGGNLTQTITVAGGGVNGAVLAPPSARTLGLVVLGGAVSTDSAVNVNAPGGARSLFLTLNGGAALAQSDASAPAAVTGWAFSVQPGGVTTTTELPAMFTGRRRYAAIALPVFY